MSSINNGSAINRALSSFTSLSTDQSNYLDQVRKTSPSDANRLEAQMKLQNQQELVAFITNLLKKQNEIAMAVINNMR